MRELLTHGIAVVTSLMTAFGASLTNIAPPAEVGGFDIPAIGSLLGLMLYLISYFIVRRFRPNKIGVLVSATLGCAAFIAVVVIYSRKSDQSTFSYEGNRYVRSQYTEEAKKYKIERPTVTDEELFNREGGNQERIWTKESLQHERQLLFMWYLGLLAIFFVAVFPIAIIISGKQTS